MSRPGRPKGRVAELRSVLRFLYLQGITPLRLGTAVPPVGGWRLAALPPPTMTAADVQWLLDSCDRSSDVGVRDFAIMTLVARLGLRSIEVARLELRRRRLAGGRARRPRRRHAGRTGSRCRPRSARPWSPTCPAGRTPAGARRLFLTCRAPRGPIRADLVGRRRGTGVPAGRPAARGAAPAAARPGRRSCCARAPGWSRSARCFVIRTWPPPPSTPRSTSTALRHVAQPWPGAAR